MADLNAHVSDELTLAVSVPSELMGALRDVEFDFEVETEEDLRAVARELGGLERFRFDPSSCLVAWHDWSGVPLTHNGEEVGRAKIRIWYRQGEAPQRPVLFPELAVLRDEVARAAGVGRAVGGV